MPPLLLQLVKSCFLLVVFLQHRCTGFSATGRSLSVSSCSSSSTTLWSSTARAKRSTTLLGDWTDSIDVKVGGVTIESMGESSGLGLVCDKEVPSGSVIVTVPTSVALSVESPGEGPDDSGVMELVTDKRAFRDLPWFVQFSCYLNKLDKVSSTKLGREYQPWVASLPRDFDTPIHWTPEDRAERLQYKHMTESIERQEQSWRQLFKTLQDCTTHTNPSAASWDDFLWGMECARSRAFSGGYTGAPFNPLVYAFTLLLVTAYVGLNLGSLEQAANGAALVFCASVLRDFVIPKLFKSKKYVICPVIDMSNHKTVGASANVAYEFFGNAYSLSSSMNGRKGDEVCISYGERSNDQLLQYYGFVEADNPNDVYIMPPLREWDIAALEKVCGGPFAAGRLGKLERAGLLGKAADLPLEDQEDGLESTGNPRGGVVLTRAVGIDPAVIQALRALVSSSAEWEAAGEAVGNFAAEVSVDNENRARLAAYTAIELELQSKPTTLVEDKELLKRMTSTKAGIDTEERLAIEFRIEKKKLLNECMDRLR